jgi:hypothetical protein
MSRRSVLASRLRALFTRGRLERELDEELRRHLGVCSPPKRVACQTSAVKTVVTD